MVKSMTMTELAKEIGVSRNVVSAVINKRTAKLGISELTVKKVTDHIEHSGYVKSKYALGLHGNTNNNSIAIMSCGPVMRYPHLVQALDILSSEIKQKNGHVDIIGIDVNNIQHGLRELVSLDTGKLIWVHASAPEYEMANASKILPLLKRMEKVVVYNYDFSNDSWEDEYLKNGIYLVGADRAECYRQVADTFKRDGHSKIAIDEIFVDHPKHKDHNIDKLVAPFLNAGFEISGLKSPGAEADVAKLTENLIYLYQQKQVSCAFIRNDKRAGEVCGRLKLAGLKVPEDIAVIGFGNDALSAWLNPPLTSFAFPVEEMCKKTMEILNSDKAQKSYRTYLKNGIILRKSHKT